MFLNNGMTADGTSDTPLVLQPPGDGEVNLCAPMNIKLSGAPRYKEKPFSNTAITGTVTVDSFDPKADGMVFYEFYVTDGSSNHRSGTIHASFDYSAGTASPTAEVKSPDIGSTTSLTVTVDMSGASGSVRLRATSASGTWQIHGLRRSLIKYQ